MPRAVEKRCRVPKKLRGRKLLPGGLPPKITCKKVFKLISCVRKIKARPKREHPKNIYAVCKHAVL